jgi:hypothetical protein
MEPFFSPKRAPWAGGGEAMAMGLEMMPKSGP